MANPFTWRHGTVTIKDGAGSPISFQLPAGEGGISMSNIVEGNAEAVALYSRSAFEGMIKGQDSTQEGSITVRLPSTSGLTSGATDRLLDVVRKAGTFAAATTKDPFGVMWAVQIEIDFDDGTNTGQIVLPCARITASVEEAQEGDTVEISYTNYQVPTYT